MPRPIAVTVTSATQSAWLPVDSRQTPFNVGMGVVLSGGAALTYTVEHTFDNIQDSSVSPTSFSNAGLIGKTANDDGNYAFPVRAIRLNVTAYTGGNATLTIIQGA